MTCNAGSTASEILLITAPSFIAAILINLNTLNAGFVYDDSRAILTNQDLRPETPLSNLFLDDFWGTPLNHSGSHKSYRPLTVLTFRANYVLSGLDPFWFHAVNVLLHAVVSCLVALLARRLLRSANYAALCGVLFALHPIHAEAVAGVVGRAELLACFWFLLSVLFYRQHARLRDAVGDDLSNNSVNYLYCGLVDKRQCLSQVNSMTTCGLFLLLSLLCALAALLSKEQGLSVLAVLKIFDLCVQNRLYFGDLCRWRTVRIGKGRYAQLAKSLFIVFVCGVSISLFRFAVMGFAVPSFSPSDNPAAHCSDWLTRTLTFLYLPAFNTRLLLCASTLSFDWSMDAVPLIQFVYDSRNLQTLAFYTVLACICIRLAKALKLANNKSPLVSVASFDATETKVTSSSRFKTKSPVFAFDIPHSMRNDIPPISSLHSRKPVEQFRNGNEIHDLTDNTSLASSQLVKDSNDSALLFVATLKRHYFSFSEFRTVFSYLILRSFRNRFVHLTQWYNWLFQHRSYDKGSLSISNNNDNENNNISMQCSVKECSEGNRKDVGEIDAANDSICDCNLAQTRSPHGITNATSQHSFNPPSSPQTLKNEFNVYKAKFSRKHLSPITWPRDSDEAVRERHAMQTMDVRNCDSLLLALAIMIFSYLPASNLLFYVGFVAAERTLYIPSVGFCLLLTTCFRTLKTKVACKSLDKRVCRSCDSLLNVCMVMLIVSQAAKTWMRNYDWQNEENLYRSGIPTNPAKAFANLGNVLYQQQRYDEAEVSYRSALKLRGNLADTHYNLGLLLHERKRYDEAIQSYHNAIQFRDRLAAAYLNLGLVLSTLGRTEEAEMIFRKCSVLDGRNLKDPKTHENTKLSCLYNLGRLYSESDQVDKALSAYHEAIAKLNPYYAPHSLYNLIGEAYSKLDNAVEAEIWFKRAILSKPDHVPAYLTYAQLLIKMKNRANDAMDLLKQAVQMDSSNAKVHQLFGQLFFELGSHAQSLSSYQTADRFEPSQFETVFAMANVLRTLQRNPEAEDFYAKAVALKPQSANALMNFGAILHLNGRYAEAEENYQNALRLNPGDKITTENLRKLRNVYTNHEVR